ncbi:hypothetical protein [Streptomyces sp. NPDC092307]|uniref:hypothetical protein n=1 Tax=Streptomyces sp. NPDC092307 TaxID=3366013 RepID=UPI003807BC1B
MCGGSSCDPVHSEAFLHEVGDTIREWETNNDDAYDGFMKNWQGTQEDPMKGLMNAMSRNPSASTHYFDPNTTDNLKYFLEDRTWPGGEVEFKMPEETQWPRPPAVSRAVRCTASPPTTTARRPRSSSGSPRNAPASRPTDSAAQFAAGVRAGRR